MKVIDFGKKGNVVRFYLGEDNDYYGDDWDDTPYEHNAGTVYDEFIKGHYDIAFPFDYIVCEPCDGELNSDYCKDDMKENKVPCIVAHKIKKGEYDWQFNFNNILGMKDSIKIYFNITKEELLEIYDTIKEGE